MPILQEGGCLLPSNHSDPGRSHAYPCIQQSRSRSSVRSRPVVEVVVVVVVVVVVEVVVVVVVIVVVD